MLWRFKKQSNTGMISTRMRERGAELLEEKIKWIWKIISLYSVNYLFSCNDLVHWPILYVSVKLVIIYDYYVLFLYCFPSIMLICFVQCNDFFTGEITSLYYCNNLVLYINLAGLSRCNCHCQSKSTGRVSLCKKQARKFL